jgi:hypothetical protein
MKFSFILMQRFDKFDATPVTLSHFLNILKVLS